MLVDGKLDLIRTYQDEMEWSQRLAIRVSVWLFVVALLLVFGTILYFALAYWIPDNNAAQQAQTQLDESSRPSNTDQEDSQE